MLSRAVRWLGQAALPSVWMVLKAQGSDASHSPGECTEVQLLAVASYTERPASGASLCLVAPGSHPGWVL